MFRYYARVFPWSNSVWLCGMKNRGMLNLTFFSNTCLHYQAQVAQHQRRRQFLNSWEDGAFQWAWMHIRNASALLWFDSAREVLAIRSEGKSGDGGGGGGGGVGGGASTVSAVVGGHGGSARRDGDRRYTSTLLLLLPKLKRNIKHDFTELFCSHQTHMYIQRSISWSVCDIMNLNWFKPFWHAMEPPALPPIAKLHGHWKFFPRISLLCCGTQPIFVFFLVSLLLGCLRHGRAADCWNLKFS